MAAINYAIGSFILAFAASFAVTPLTARIARRLGILDRPESSSHKSHNVVTPYLGGVAIVAGVAVGCAVLTAVPGNQFYFPPGKITIGLLIAAGLALVGLIDDVRPVPRSLRLLAQLMAAFGAWSAGFRVSLLPSEELNALITVIWIVGITNAFNLLDNMDGLSAGLAAIAALGFTTMGLVEGLPILLTVTAALTGSLVGFLAHNKHPAKIFMGDAGSLFLGFLLALIGINFRFDNLLQVTFLVPVVVLGLPIFDTSLVVMSRLLHHRPVFLGGRDHVSHRLVRLGLSVKVAVGLLYWAGLCLGWLGLVISRSTQGVGWMLLGFVFAVGLFFGVLLLRVPVYDEDAAAVDSDEEAMEREGLPYIAAMDNVSEALIAKRSAERRR